MSEPVLHQIAHDVDASGQIIGTRCEGCDWSSKTVLVPGTAVIIHDQVQGLVHDHADWVSIEQPSGRAYCPCGQPRQQRLDETSMMALGVSLLHLLEHRFEWRPDSPEDHSRFFDLAQRVGEDIGAFLEERSS